MGGPGPDPVKSSFRHRGERKVTAGGRRGVRVLCLVALGRDRGTGGLKEENHRAEW